MRSMYEALPSLPDVEPGTPLPLRKWSTEAPLSLLALDTSTDRLSIAVGRWPAGAAARGEAPRTWAFEGPGAAHSSSTLLPSLLRLLGEAGCTLRELDAVVFGAGPGSFTGLRTACSVAQGLALGAHLPVLPVDTLLAVAEDWRVRQTPVPTAGLEVWSLLDARMDEMYAARWRWQPGAQGLPAWSCVADALLVHPEDLSALPGWQPSVPCVGNVAAVYGPRLPVSVMPAMPTAEAMLRLAPALLAQSAAVDAALALPRYVRDKVAQTIAEREAARAAAAEH